MTLQSTLLWQCLETNEAFALAEDAPGNALDPLFQLPAATLQACDDRRLSFVSVEKDDGLEYAAPWLAAIRRYQQAGFEVLPMSISWADAERLAKSIGVEPSFAMSSANTPRVIANAFLKGPNHCCAVLY